MTKAAPSMRQPSSPLPIFRAVPSHPPPAGRLKGPEYVAATTQVYRRAVDAAWAALTASDASASGEHAAADAPSAAAAAAAGRVQLSDDEWRELQQVWRDGW